MKGKDMGKRGRPAKQPTLALVTVEPSKLEGVELEIFDQASALRKAFVDTGTLYRELVVLIHEKYGDPKRAYEILVAAGLPDYVASKIKTVAFALPETYTPYAKGVIGFKATVEAARDEKAGKGGKGGKSSNRSPYQKLFNECVRLLNRGKLNSEKPVVRALKGGWHFVLWNNAAKESLPAVLKAAGYISKAEAAAEAAAETHSQPEG